MYYIYGSLLNSGAIDIIDQSFLNLQKRSTNFVTVLSPCPTEFKVVSISLVYQMAKTLYSYLVGCCSISDLFVNGELILGSAYDIGKSTSTIRSPLPNTCNIQLFGQLLADI